MYSVSRNSLPESSMNLTRCNSLIYLSVVIPLPQSFLSFLCCPKILFTKHYIIYNHIYTSDIFSSLFTVISICRVPVIQNDINFSCEKRWIRLFDRQETIGIYTIGFACCSLTDLISNYPLLSVRENELTRQSLKS